MFGSIKCCDGKAERLWEALRGSACKEDNGCLFGRRVFEMIVGLSESAEVGFELAPKRDGGSPYLPVEGVDYRHPLNRRRRAALKNLRELLTLLREAISLQ